MMPIRYNPRHKPMMDMVTMVVEVLKEAMVVVVCLEEVEVLSEAVVVVVCLEEVEARLFAITAIRQDM